jgi:hypothetical protein
MAKVLATGLTLVALAALAALFGTSGGGARPLPRAASCPVFPRSNVWNQRVDGLPLHRNSAAIVASVGADEGLHPDFGAGRYEGRPIGIPYNVVDRRTRRSRVSFEYADESDRGPYPIPRRPRVEGGSDRHILIVDRSRCRLYELFAAERRDGRWHAGSGAIWNLRSNRLRPAGWTSADAAGLPILPGLARYDEVRRGRIDHALRFTVRRSRRAYTWPARHFASDLTDGDLPRMGERLRLRRSFDVRPFPRQVRVILAALKRYGMIVADNGSDWYVSGVPDRGWNDDQLVSSLRRVRGRDFEVVDSSRLRRRRP